MDEDDEYEEEGEESPETAQRTPGLQSRAGSARTASARPAADHRGACAIVAAPACSDIAAQRAPPSRAAVRARGAAQPQARPSAGHRRDYAIVERAKAFAIAAARLRRRVRMLKKVAVGAKLRAAS